MGGLGRSRRSLAGVSGLAAALVAAQPSAAQSPGADVFAHNCVACHQATGKGIPGAFPALAGDPFVKGPPDKVILTVLKGRGGMPRFGTELSDAEIAAAITYIRGSWGNTAPAVDASAVLALRGSPAPAPGSGPLQSH